MLMVSVCGSFRVSPSSWYLAGVDITRGRSNSAAIGTAKQHSRHDTNTTEDDTDVCHTRMSSPLCACVCVVRLLLLIVGCHLSVVGRVVKEVKWPIASPTNTRWPHQHTADHTNRITSAHEHNRLDAMQPRCTLTATAMTCMHRPGGGWNLN